MKEEKIYNVRYSESKGKIKLYLEPKKLVFKKTKGLFKKETIIVDTILLDDIKTKRNEVNLDIDYNEVCIETKDKFILITFDELKDVDKFVKELKEAIKKRKKILADKRINNIKNYVNVGITVATTIVELYNRYKGDNKDKK